MPSALVPSACSCRRAHPRVRGRQRRGPRVPWCCTGRLGTLTHLSDASTGGSDDYRYELTDHLGDARVVFHRPTTTTEVETLELSGVSGRASFLNADRYRVPASNAPSGDYVARLTDSQPAGQELKRVLAVTRGDTITFSALGQWKQNAAANGSNMPYVLIGAAAGVNALSQRGADGQTTTYATNNPNWLSLLAGGLGFTLGQGAPAALGASSLEGWIKYRVLDAQGNPMLDSQGKPLAGVDYLLGTGKWEYLQTGVRIPQDGTIEIMAGTSGTGEAVYFDNLRVEQTGSLIVQEQHQYAFGAPMPGLSYTVGGVRKYRYSYQGQYAEHDGETGLESFELRLYNSRIGRWLSYDPEGQYSSPYLGMGNNPVSGMDPTGGFNFGGIWDKIKGVFRGGGGWSGTTDQMLSEVVVTGSRVGTPLVSGGLALTAPSLLGSAYTASRSISGAQRIPVPDPSVLSEYQAGQINHKLNPQQYGPGGSHYNYLSEALESVYPEHYLIPAFAELRAARLATSLAPAFMDGETIIGADYATGINFKYLRSEEGIHQVLIHGTTDGFIENGAFMTPQALAERMLQEGYVKGTPIRLISCNTGAYVDGAAYQLSEILEAPVLAPSVKVGIAPGGEYVLSKSMFRASVWKTFFQNTVTVHH